MRHYVDVTNADFKRAVSGDVELNNKATLQAHVTTRKPTL